MSGIAWLTGSPGVSEPNEYFGSVKENIDRTSQTCTVQLTCPWADRYTVYGNILNNTLDWPYRPTDGVFATGGNIQPLPGEKGVSDGGSGLVYGTALLTINFTFGTDNSGGSNGDIAHFSEEMQPAAEMLTVPFQGLSWGNTVGLGDDPRYPGQRSSYPQYPITQAEAPGKITASMDWCLTYYGITTLSGIAAAAFNLAGYLNSSSVTSARYGMTFAAKTLICWPPTISSSYKIGTIEKFDVKMRFGWRPQTWNKFWWAGKPGGPAWSPMYTWDGATTFTAYEQFPNASFAGIIP